MHLFTMKRNVWAAIILVLCCISSVSAQTKWVNPLELGDSMVHGRWWHQELKSNYHRFRMGSFQTIGWSFTSLSYERSFH